MRERTSWVEEQDSVEANRVGRNVCALELPGCRLWDQPAQQEAAERGIPQYPTNLWALKVFLVAWRCRLCKKINSGLQNDQWIEVERELESLMQRSCAPSVPVRVNTASASVNSTVWWLSSCMYPWQKKPPKTREKELCLKKCWYFVYSVGLSSLLICPLLWKSPLWTQNGRDNNMPRYTEKSWCAVLGSLALLMHLSACSSRSLLCS